MKIIPCDYETQRLHADILGKYPDFLILDVTNPERPDIIVPGGRLPISGGLDGIASLIRTICPT